MKKKQYHDDQIKWKKKMKRKGEDQNKNMIKHIWEIK